MAVLVEEHRNILEHMEELQKTINGLVVQNCSLKKQLAQMQDNFQRLVHVHCLLGSSLPGHSGKSITVTPLTPSSLQHTVPLNCGSVL